MSQDSGHHSIRPGIADHLALHNEHIHAQALDKPLLSCTDWWENIFLEYNLLDTVPAWQRIDNNYCLFEHMFDLNCSFRGNFPSLFHKDIAAELQDGLYTLYTLNLVGGWYQYIPEF